MNITIAHADTEETIMKCYPVMVQLRPHLTEPEFILRVRRQQSDGYRLAYLEQDSRICAVAGFRYAEGLGWGRYCYVDDLVTDSDERSHGFGGMLFDWLVTHAREAGCEQIHLDSGVQRFSAHRFYLAKRMSISCHHFSMSL